MSKRQNPVMRDGISRRSFLGGAALAVLGASSLTLGGCGSQGSGSASYLPESWDEECDILVVGYGGAGAAAAITATQEDLGKVLVLEAGPEGTEGGNTRVSGNLMFIPDNASDAVTYQKALNGPYEVEDELLQAWADELVKNVEWLEDLGATMKSMPLFAPEFPEVEGSKSAKTYCVDGKFSMPSLWEALKEQEEALGFAVRYGHRATKLIHDPETREVFGVSVQTEEGAEKKIKASKGVVLACGGFENNLEMMKTYYELGCSEVRPVGTPYNRGDGFSMIEPLGAKLWHMNNTAGNGYYVRSGGAEVENVGPFAFSGKDYIYVGPDGKRFMYEEKTGLARHGKIYERGTWITMPTPTPAYAIFGQKSFDAAPVVTTNVQASFMCANKLYLAEDNQSFVDKGVISKADTIEDLAEAIGYDPQVLKDTLEAYNASAASGTDGEFGRGEAVYDSFSMANNVAGDAGGDGDGAFVAIEPFTLEAIEGPFYAIELVPRVLNTQGGPKRTAKGEVTDTEGSPIPRLCAAGEFGCVYSYMYNGGGNVSEALSSGRTAVRTIGSLEPWDSTESGK